jgi:hypothetical protein
VLLSRLFADNRWRLAGGIKVNRGRRATHLVL